MVTPPETVETMMTTGLVTVSPDTPLLDAQRLFAEHRFHHLPVVEKDELVGVISDRDILRALSPFVDTLAERAQDLETIRRRVHSVMTRALVTVEVDAEVAHAAELMLAKRVSCLPVVARGRLVGILTTRDMLRWVVGVGTGVVPPASSRIAQPPPSGRPSRPGNPRRT
jgi:acetoin utilization protein AcuB